MILHRRIHMVQLTLQQPTEQQDKCGPPKEWRLYTFQYTGDCGLPVLLHSMMLMSLIRVPLPNTLATHSRKLLNFKGDRGVEC